MPDVINIPIDTMEIGHSVRVEDIKIDGITFLNASNIKVVGVETTRVVVEEVNAAAPAAAGAKTAAAPAAGAKAAAAPAAGAKAAAPAAKK